MSQRAPGLTIRAQLLLLTAFVALPGAAVLAWHLVSEWNLAIETAHGRSTQIAESLAGQLSSTFRDREAVLRELGSAPPCQGHGSRRMRPDSEHLQGRAS